MGRVWIKGVGEPFNARSVHTSSIQSICRDVQHYLHSVDERGWILCDHSATLGLHAAHAVFTQKFRAAGDPFDRLLEMPTYGDSRNYVGLQIADQLASGLVFPLATYSYGLERIESVHVQQRFGLLKGQHAQELKRLQYRYWVGDRRRGGLVVSDGLTHRSGSLLFAQQDALSPGAR